MRTYLRIMVPLALAYAAGAIPGYWPSVVVLVVAQVLAVWLWGER